MKLYRYACNDICNLYTHTHERWHKGRNALYDTDYFEYVLRSTGYVNGTTVVLESINEYDLPADPLEPEEYVNVETKWEYITEGDFGYWVEKTN